MCDLNWCPVCDQAISCESDSLYCSINCFSKDAVRNLTHDSFQTFLLPKDPLACSLKTTNSHFDLPELSASIYTSSSASSASTYTRSSRNSSQAQNITNKLSNTFNIYKNIDDDEDSITSCCDYCENIKNSQQVLAHSNSNALQQPFFIPIFNK